MHDDVRFADEGPRRKPDYEVKQPDGTPQPLFYKDPLQFTDSVPNAAMEVYISDSMRDKGTPALLVDGVDVLAEIGRSRFYIGALLVTQVAVIGFVAYLFFRL